MDPDAILKSKIVEFVGRGDFGLASGRKTERQLRAGVVRGVRRADEVAFDAGVFLLRKDPAKTLKMGAPPEPTTGRMPSRVRNQ